MKNHKYYPVITFGVVVICLLCTIFLLKKENPVNQLESSSLQTTQNSSNEQVSSSSSKESESSQDSKESSQEESLSETAEDLPFFNSADELMNAMLEKYNMDVSNLAVSYYNFNSEETYQLNEDIAMMAASTNKVTTAIMFIDLIDQGVLSWDTPFVYNPALHEDGGGTVTNGTPKPTYTLEELIYESLYYSDNTAWNMLIDWYYRHVGDFQEGLKTTSNVEFTDPNINVINYATSNMLLSILHQVVTQPEYDFVKQTMLDSQEGMFLKREFNEGFGAKYGQYETNFHDIGFYLKDGQPQYLIVVLSTNSAGDELFLGELNLQLRQYNEDQFHSY